MQKLMIRKVENLRSSRINYDEWELEVAEKNCKERLKGQTYYSINLPL